MTKKKSKEDQQTDAKSRYKLDINTIVKAARKLLNEEGLQKLTTRRLADELGIRSASLYWHVKDKAELMQLLAESICSEIEVPDSGLPWREQVFAFASEYRIKLLSIRDSAEVLLETPPLTPKRLLLIEAMFNILLKAEFPPKEIILGASLISDYILSFVKNEMIVVNMAQLQGISVKELMIISKNFFSDLSPEQYPTIVSLADYMTYENMDEQFMYGLNLLIESLQKRLNSK